MRRSRFAVLLVVGAGALAVAGVAYPTGGPNSQLVKQVRIYGGGGTDPGCFVPDISFCRTAETNFAIDAHATGAGQPAYGDRVGAGAHEQITCLGVDGHNGVVGGIVTTAPSRPSIVGDVFVEFYVDNGTLDFGGDLISPFFIFDPGVDALPAGFPYVCPSPDTGAPSFGMIRSFLPIARGDIVVQQGGQ